MHLFLEQLLGQGRVVVYVVPDVFLLFIRGMIITKEFSVN